MANTKDINTIQYAENKTRAYIVYVRPLLEYNSVTWSPYTLQDIKAPGPTRR